MVQELARRAVQYEQAAVAGQEHKSRRCRQESGLSARIWNIPDLLRRKRIHRPDEGACRVSLLQCRKRFPRFLAGGTSAEPSIAPRAKRIGMRRVHLTAVAHTHIEQPR